MCCSIRFVNLNPVRDSFRTRPLSLIFGPVLRQAFLRLMTHHVAEINVHGLEVKGNDDIIHVIVHSSHYGIHSLLAHNATNLSDSHSRLYIDRSVLYVESQCIHPLLLHARLD